MGWCCLWLEGLCWQWRSWDVHPAGNAGCGHHSSATELRWDGMGDVLDAKTSLWFLDWEVAERGSLRHPKAASLAQGVSMSHSNVPFQHSASLELGLGKSQPKWQLLNVTLPGTIRPLCPIQAHWGAGGRKENPFFSLIWWLFGKGWEFPSGFM